MSSTNTTQKAQQIKETVRSGYAAVATAEEPSSCCAPTCCGGNVDSATQLAASVGYSKDQLEGLPQGANMGLSCGNPTALAQLKEGETVVDLGSGGGFDIFIAGRNIGPEGRAIGVDMTPEMISKARRNADVYTKRTGMSNVEFRLGEIEHLPLPDQSVDVVISNCVINLSPDKPQVFAEIARILKPGGRIAVSDIVLKKPLPQPVLDDAAALIGCVAGALVAEELKAIITELGFSDVVFEEKPGYVEAMAASKDLVAARVLSLLNEGESLADYVASMNITARKP